MRTEGNPVILLDVEASGLHDGSYPTEIGWCRHDLSRGGSYLVRPTSEWLATPWSAQAEALTGISQMCLEKWGLPVDVIAERLNTDIGGTDPMTDYPWGDGRWLRMLHAAAGIPPNYGICPMPPTEPGWRAQMAWAEEKAPYDLDARVAQMATKARLMPDAIELETARLFNAAGLVAHRALDDAIGHALAMGVVGIMAMPTTNQRDKNRARYDLVARAKALKLSVPRCG